MKRKEIVDFLSEQKPFLEQKFGVKRIGLFGSYLRGEETPESDIDLLVEMPSSLEKFFDLKDYLESKLPAPVDLGLSHTLRSYIRKNIESDILYV